LLTSCCILFTDRLILFEASILVFFREE
jgi:hypothetical protein